MPKKFEWWMLEHAIFKYIIILFVYLSMFLEVEVYIFTALILNSSINLFITVPDLNIKTMSSYNNALFSYRSIRYLGEIYDGKYISLTDFFNFQFFFSQVIWYHYCLIFILHFFFFCIFFSIQNLITIRK